MHTLLRTARHAATALTAAAIVLGLSACAVFRESSPSSFYVLSAELPQGQQPLFAQGQAGAPTLAVANVRVAGYLDRPQMTLRVDENQVNFSEFVRWAEPLGDGVGRILRLNFVNLLGTPDSALPWTRAYPRDYNLFVQVEDIHLDKANHRLGLGITYRLSHGRTNSVVVADETILYTDLPKDIKTEAFYDELAGLISRQLGEFSVQVAQRVSELKRDQVSAEAVAPAAAKPAAATAPKATDAPKADAKAEASEAPAGAAAKSKQ